MMFERGSPQGGQISLFNCRGLDKAHGPGFFERAGEVAVAAMIVGAVFWVPWAYYLLTGNYMEFR